MTVLSTVNSVSYTTNGSITGPFVVPFYFLTDTDLVVQATIAGIGSTLVKDTDYTVSGAGNPSGGSVTTLIAQPTGTLTIYRSPAIIQDASYQDHGRFPASSHERALDRRAMVEQSLKRQIDVIQSEVAAVQDEIVADFNALEAQIVAIVTNGNGGKQVTVDLNTLGADPTGVADLAPLVNSIAAALGPAGGTMTLDPGTYKVGSTLILGNGTSSAGSTMNNIRLEGRVAPKLTPNFTGYPASAGGITLSWSGGAAPMIQFAGPMQNWGVKNLYIEGNNVALYGLVVISAQFGVSSDVSIAGCRVAGVYSTTVLPFGTFANTDSFRNRYDNFLVNVPDVDGAKGVWLTAGAGPTVVDGVTVASDTDYNTFWNLLTYQAASSNINYGLYLQGTDGNFFYHYKPIIGGFNNETIVFDYTLTSFWPEGNYFFGVEPGAPVNIGTPDGNSRPNVFYGVVEGNGNVYPTNLANTQNAMPAVFGKVVDLTGQTAAIALTTAISPPPWKTGMYRINYYMGITTAGTAGTGSIQFQWNDNAAVQDWVSATTPLTALGFISGSLDVFLLAGTNIGYQTNLVGATGSPAYQVHLRIERLD